MLRGHDCREMADKLTKYERKLVSKGASGARSKAMAQARTGRALGLGAGLLASKLDASGMLSTTIPLPGMGTKKISEVGGWALMLMPLLLKSPGTFTQAAGMAGFALVCRSVKK